MSFELEDIEHSKDGNFDVFNIKVKDAVFLIGKRGESVYALNYLIKRIVEKGAGITEEIPVMIDVDGYLESSIRTLKTKAKILGERARSFRTNVELEPMRPFERKIIHTFLENETDLRTESTGFGESRRVIIKYVGKPEEVR